MQYVLQYKRNTFTKNSSSGFTLLESIIVMLMMGVLMAIAAPSWNAFLNKQTLNTAQDQAFQLMRQAQAEAIRHQVPWQASFRMQNGRVQGAIHSTTTPAIQANWQNFVSHVQIDTKETTLLLSNSIYRVRFSHKGRVNGQIGRITLVGRHDTRTKRCVFVSTLLGTLRKAENRPRAQNGRFCY
jgi:prepilin-type N-terminal cleavage/methylation domain-containing protein